MLLFFLKCKKRAVIYLKTSKNSTFYRYFKAAGNNNPE